MLMLQTVLVLITVTLADCKQFHPFVIEIVYMMHISMIIVVKIYDEAGKIKWSLHPNEIINVFVISNMTTILLKMKHKRRSSVYIPKETFHNQSTR